MSGRRAISVLVVGLALAAPALHAPSYEILVVGGYDVTTDTLSLDVDCPSPYARGYRVQWRVDAEELAVVCHWQVDGEGLQEHTHDLDPCEVRELERWLESSFEVWELVQHMRREARALEDPRA